MCLILILFFEAVILPLHQLLIASTDVEGRSSKDLEGFQKVFELFIPKNSNIIIEKPGWSSITLFSREGKIDNKIVPIVKRERKGK